MSRLLFFLCTYWVILLNNSRMPERMPTAGTLCIFPVPRQIRFLEVALLVFLYYAAVREPMPRQLRRIHLLVLLFSLTAVAGLLLLGDVGAVKLQEVYIRVAPFLVFLAAGTFGVTRARIRSLTKVFVVATLASTAIMLGYQVPFHGGHEDFFHGFFSDAHILGSLLAILSVGTLSLFLETRKAKYLIATAILFAISFVPSNQKVILLTAAWYALLFYRGWLREKHWAFRVAFGLAVVTAVGVGYGQLEQAVLERSGLRLTQLLSFGVERAGPMVAWSMAFEQVARSLSTFLVGLGAGEYGWIAAFREVSAGGGSPTAQLFSLEFSFDNTNNSGFLFRTNTWTSLLAEFGVIGFVAFVTPLLTIAWRVFRATGDDPFERTIARVWIFALAVVIYQGFFTPFSNWSESILVFPLMYVAGYYFPTAGPPPPDPGAPLPVDPSPAAGLPPAVPTGDPDDPGTPPRDPESR